MGGKYIIVGEKCKLLAENSICWQSESVKVEGIHFYLSAGIPLQWLRGRKMLVFIMFTIVALLMMIIDYLHRLMILRLCLLGCVASCSIRHWSRVSCVSLHDVINSGPEIGQNQFSLYLLYFRYVLCQMRQHLHHKANRAPCVILCDLFNRLWVSTEKLFKKKQW